MIKIIDNKFKWSCFNNKSKILTPLIDGIMLDLTCCDGFEYFVNNGVFTLDEPYLIEKEFMGLSSYINSNIPDEFYLHKLCLNITNEIAYGKCTLDDKIFYIALPISIDDDDVTSDNHMN